MRRRIILEGNKTEKVTINISTSNGASASGITVTINGSATTTNADGVAYGEVPFDTEYSIVFGTKTNYSTPATITRTASAETYTTAVTYTLLNENCTVTTNLATTITINGNKKTNTTTHSVSVPYGTTYTVSVIAKSGYGTPSNKTFTASTSSRSVTMYYTLYGHEFVDLGLPSGTLWATMNVGASSPTDYGNYYKYGSGATARAMDGTYYSGTENPLSSSRDTATQVWGGSWHMPTSAQCQELIDQCTWTWTTNGHTVSKNGKSIFLPAAGYYVNGSFNSGGLQGFCWSSTPLDSDLAYRLYFDYNGYKVVNDSYRICGFSVRPVIG